MDAEYQKEWQAWESAKPDERGDPPEKPGPTPRMVREDDTSEALLMHLSEYPVAAVICSEAGIIFGGHAMKPEQVQRHMAQANKLWDGGPIIEGRVKRGETNIPSVRVTMGLMVQPHLMQKLLNQNDGMARGIPYQIDGDTGLEEQDVEAFMLLTGSTQRAKSFSCEQCPNFLELRDPKVCGTCYWAFPEAYQHIGMRQVRQVEIVWQDEEAEAFDRIKAKLAAEGRTIEEAAKALLLTLDK